MTTTQRDRMQKRRTQAKRQQIITWALVSVAVVAVIGLIIFQSAKVDDHSAQDPVSTGGIGEMVPVVKTSHVNDGEPVESPSDPPTSGTHYGVSMPAGFYQVDSPEYLDPTHDGYLIHSLEHGYIIFWYNCDLLDEASCSTLQSEIQDVMDEFEGKKLIAFPRPSLSVPLVMTSWGYLQEFETFDADLAAQFVETNQPLAPEPGGL